VGTQEVIASWNELVSFLQTLPPVDMACRGEDKTHADMTPKLDRCLDLPDLDSRLRVERALCQRFSEHAPIYLSPVEARYLKSRWLELVVMQHYGAPTRLLDWTKSPWVAVFFAVSAGWESDGRVYGFRRDSLERLIIPTVRDELPGLVCGPHRSDLEFSDEEWDLAEANSKLFDPSMVSTLSEWVVTYYCRAGHFPRLVAQQGLFTFASKPRIDHWKYVSGRLSLADCFELTIKHAAKPEILRRLNAVGINAATLFPGMEGIGRSMEGFARAWHLSPRPSQF